MHVLVPPDSSDTRGYPLHPRDKSGGRRMRTGAPTLSLGSTAAEPQRARSHVDANPNRGLCAVLYVDAFV